MSNPRPGETWERDYKSQAGHVLRISLRVISGGHGVATFQGPYWCTTDLIDLRGGDWLRWASGARRVEDGG